MYKPFSIILLICLCAISEFSFAQEFSHEFGILGKTEREFKVYSKDTLADAVVIFDIGKSRFVDDASGFDIIYSRRVRIKIFEKSAYDYANVSIPYYHDKGKTEKIKGIKATAYNLIDGRFQPTKLDPKNIYKEKLSENWDMKSFAIPNVKEGTIIEYRYELVTPFKFNLPDWDIQWEIPVIHTEYEIRMIPFYEYSFILQGTDKFDEWESQLDEGKSRRLALMNYNDMVHNLVMKDVPAFTDQSYITSKDDYIIKLDLQLSKVNQPDGRSENIMTTWEEMSNRMLEHELFGGYTKKIKKQGKKLLEEIDLSGNQDSDAEKIIHYVRKNYLWDGQYSKYTLESPKSVIQSKKGSSAEINLLMLGLLQAADIEAYPVLISTRDHGRIHYNYPFNHFFNSVILFVKTTGYEFLTDGTNSNIPFFQVPINCVNEKGLIVRPDSEDWVTVSIPSSKTSYNINIKIDQENEKISSTTRKSLSGYDALGHKARYANDYSKITNRLKNIGFQNVELKKTINFDAPHKLYSIIYSASNDMESYGDKIFVSPFLLEVNTMMKLKELTRRYPVDIIYPKERIYTSNIAIPDEYQLEELPANLSFSNELVEFQYEVKGYDSFINTTGTYKLKKQVYVPSEYSNLKQHLESISRKLNEQLVFTKKSSDD